MESLGYSVDWTLHQEIAAANGITDFTGTADQNTQLLNLLKAGKLIIPGSGSGSSSGGSSGTVTDGKTGYDRGYTGGKAGTGTIYAKGLDVSGWQDINLNFSKIKAAGYSYVILRAGTTKGKDTNFETFYKNAKAAGLHVGAYYYSYALTVSEAKADADDFLSYIAGKTYEYPLYFDFEDPTQITLDYTLQKNICLAFMDKIAAKGYLTGMYTGKYHASLLDMNTICAKYESWIAHYLRSDGDGTNDWTTYGYTYSTQFGMYQYTANCYVSGLSGYYDADLCYKDYPSIVKKYGFNGYSPEGGSGSDSGGSDSGDSGGTETGTYFDECTFYPSHVEIKVKTATQLYTEPRSNGTSEQIEEAPIDTVYATTGMYANSAGNMWYRVKASDGTTGYIYSGRVNYVKKLYDDIKLTNYDTPNGHVAGNIFYVTGTISSSYTTITEARVYIHSGFGTDGTKITGGSAKISNNKYVLDNSAIDDATSFGDLTPGKYTYVVTVPNNCYYASDTKTAKQLNSTRTLLTHYFTVISSSVSQSSCKHSGKTTTVLKAATCTAKGTSVESCPTCGLTTKITTAASHNYGSYTTTKAATCTEAGSKQRTCKDCGNVNTATIAATGHNSSAATCTAAAVCKTCGATTGDALGHSYAAATCTKPKTCTRCSATSGAAAGHKWVAATCSKPKTCSTCGTTSGSTIDHIYAGSTCTMCGKTAASANDGNAQAGTYLADCTFYPSHVQIKVTTATQLYTEPRSATSTNTSKSIEEVALGTTLTTIGMFKNTGGNMWYQVKASDGTIGYIYSGRVEYVKKLYDDIKLNDYTAPEAIVAGKTFNVTGTITSSYTTITEARVYVYSGFGTSGTQVTGGVDTIVNNYYELANSPVADATSIKDLPAGQYTYVITARNNCYYASDTKTAKLANSTRTLLKHYFTVVKSAVDQSTCSHSKMSTTVIDAATCSATGTSVESGPTCGLTNKITTDKTSHNYGSYTVTKEATCTEAGSKQKTCADCGKVYTATIAATGHKWDVATCTAAKTCTVCGTTSGAADGHDWKDATCSTPKTCATCGATSGSALGHSYTDATCTAPKTCTTCGATSGTKLGHDYEAATCTTPKTCNRCGGTSGAPLGHDWKAATCTTPKTCSVCKVTTGAPNGHTWVAATCTEPKNCTSCGATDGSALGHYYVNGICDRCGEKSAYITIYFENNWMWSDVSVYFWGSSTVAEVGWPGTAMTYVETDGYGYDIYSAQIPADATGIIFNGKKDDGSDTLDQSPDITNISGDVCYYMAWDNGNSYNTFPYPITSAIAQKGRTLSYEDLIYVIDIFELTGIEGVDLTKDAGLLIWSVEEFEALSQIAFDAEHANVGLKPYKETGYYCGSSDGIFTRDLHEEAYYVGYVKLPNGSYIYSDAKLYSPATYAYNMLEKSSTSASTKDLCVALLNYISAAQVYFHGTAEADLVNAQLTAAQKTLTWDNVPVNLAPEVPANKQVNKDSTVFTGTGKNLLFEEMISMTAIFKISDSIINDARSCGTIFWTAEQFAELQGTPSISNYGNGIKTQLTQYRGNAGQWCSMAPEVAAKEMADTQYYYMAYVVHSDGSISYSGVSAYTIETYIDNKANTSTSMGQFAIALYYYERAAKAALGG